MTDPGPPMRRVLLSSKNGRAHVSISMEIMGVKKPDGAFALSGLGMLRDCTAPAWYSYCFVVGVGSGSLVGNW